jgi:hypothetical protein
MLEQTLLPPASKITVFEACSCLKCWSILCHLGSRVQPGISVQAPKLASFKVDSCMRIHSAWRGLHTARTNCLLDQAFGRPLTNQQASGQILLGESVVLSKHTKSLWQHSSPV